MASLQIRGERTSGADVRQQNTMAALAIANVLKVRCVCLLSFVFCLCVSLGRSTRATAFHANHTTNYNNDTTTNHK